ncbi:MAG: Clp protease N-terminal domain-containing protein [Terrimicrobiaceae bacterium]|nr:Clp protease N-terminal domain-containing protein [Terrimicrobiaceae bacterium]
MWKIAEVEARNLGSREIEPAHFFLGLLKIVDLSVGFIAEYFHESRHESVEILTCDVFALRAAFIESALESTPIRRKLRSGLHSGLQESVGRLRRSAESRAVFRDAESASGLTVRPLHLLRALLNAKPPILEVFLNDAGVDYSELVLAVQTSIRVNNGGVQPVNLLHRKKRTPEFSSELRRKRN